MRQRFRWSFGILQAIFKHRGAIAKHRAMGLFALPNILIFQILLPLVSPFIDLMFVFGVIHYFIDKHFHPETASTTSFYKLLTFFLAFLVIDFTASALAFAPRAQDTPPAKATDGSSFTSGSSASPTARSSPSSSSRHSSAPSTASPSPGTSWNAPPKCPKPLTNLPPDQGEFRYIRSIATVHMSETEAARDFAALMTRVRSGDEIVIEAEARPIARITPTQESQERLLSECLRLAKAHANALGYSPVMDAEYAADMEEIIRKRRPADHSAWD